MKITGPNPHAASGFKALTDRPDPEVRPLEEATEPEVTSPEGDGGDKVKGVIRNLLDGHYKGVADVRLRIVHYEELAALQSGQAKEAAGPAVDELLAKVGEGIAQIPEPEAPAATEDGSSDTTTTVAGLYQDFVKQVQGLSEAFQSAETPSKSDLISGIQGAFTRLVTSLQGLLVPPAEEPAAATDVPAEGEAVTEGEVTPPVEGEAAATTDETPASEEQATVTAEVDYQSLMDNLSSTFASAMTQIEEAMSSNQSLPPLSGPNGNGKAYDKFLSTYNQLWSQQPADDNPTGSESLNIAT